MTAVTGPDPLADPIGVITGLICAAEPSMDRAVIARVAEDAAGGRSRPRRLAQALLDNPGVLADGRSPGPQAVADLLIALRKAGAVNISPPRCAECGRHVRTFQRRGEDWYCGVCGPVREPCSSCGRIRPVGIRDRDGKPRCRWCPLDGDPVTLIAEAVTAADPSLAAGTVAAAVASAVPRPGQRWPLAWALEDRPALLTGDGADAPVPSVLRLIDNLCDAGAESVARPACSGCGRVVRLRRQVAGKWACGNCAAKSRARACSRCGTARDGRSQQECPEGRPAPVTECSGCGREAPCETETATGQPWCRNCRRRYAECAGCGKTRPVYGGTAGRPLCRACTPPGHSPWHTCPDCGTLARILPGRPCPRCTLRRKLDALLADGSGNVHPGLRAFRDTLAGTARPATVVRWLDNNKDSTLLRELASGERPISHDSLDELPDTKPLRHLRAILVAAGTLPPRDEQLARLAAWTARAVAARPDPGQRKRLHRYAVWHVIRRLRGRLNGEYATNAQARAAKQKVRAAVALLDWLGSRGLTLESARQGDLDAWMSEGPPGHRVDAGNFVRWARRGKLTRLDFAAVRWGGPSGTIDAEARWEQARRLLHDDTLRPEDRVAGLLVLLYAQRATAISRLTLDHVTSAGGQVLLRLGREPVALPEPLGTLVLQLAATRRGHAALGDDGASPWLFPGGQPGQPISDARVTERLRQVGVYCGQARSAALFQLAADLPAALLASMLGIHISAAVAWQRASAGDWTGYAANVSRRDRPGPRPSPQQAPL